MKFWRDHASYPFRSHELWFLTEDQRWRHLPADLDTKALIAKVNREDLWREAAKAIGVPADQIPSSTSRGVETFFDGKVFDPENPAAYLASLAIKRVLNMSERITTLIDDAGERRPGPARVRTHAGRAARARAGRCATRCRRCSRWASCSGSGSCSVTARAAALPPPSQVLTDTWPLIVDPFFDHGGVDKGMFWHIAASLKRVALGFSLAAAVGIALGVLIGQSSLAYRGLDPIFQVLRTVPPLAWLPLSLAAFQQADPSAIFVIFITAIWPIILNTAVGIREIPQDYVNVARVLRLSPLEYFFKIMLPATVPYMFTGLKIGIGLSWLAIIAAEMLIGGVGIGFFIWDAWNSSLMSEIILALVYVGLVGFLLDRAISLLAAHVGGRTRSTRRAMTAPYLSLESVRMYFDYGHQAVTAPCAT